MTDSRDDAAESPFGPHGADDKGEGQTPLDKPATPDEDLAIDERREKPIRGPEKHDGDK